MIDQNFLDTCTLGHGISTDKKKHCLWIIQSSSNSLGTRVPELFLDFLWKISISVCFSMKTLIIGYNPNRSVSKAVENMQFIKDLVSIFSNNNYTHFSQKNISFINLFVYYVFKTW